MPCRSGLRLTHTKAGFKPCVPVSVPFLGWGPGDLNTPWEAPPTYTGVGVGLTH